MTNNKREDKAERKREEQVTRLENIYSSFEPVGLPGEKLVFDWQEQQNLLRGEIVLVYEAGSNPWPAIIMGVMKRGYPNTYHAVLLGMRYATERCCAVSGSRIHPFSMYLYDQLVKGAGPSI